MDSDKDFKPKTEDEIEQEESGKVEQEKNVLEKQQRQIILRKMRDTLGIKSMRDPIMESYMTLVQGGSKKFHYFVLMMTDDRKYVAANAYGRIGAAKPSVKEIATAPSKIDAMNLMKKKMRDKLRKYNEATIEK